MLLKVRVKAPRGHQIHLPYVAQAAMENDGWNIWCWLTVAVIVHDLVCRCFLAFAVTLCKFSYMYYYCKVVLVIARFKHHYENEDFFDALTLILREVKFGVCPHCKENSSMISVWNLGMHFSTTLEFALQHVQHSPRCHWLSSYYF